MKKTVSHFLLFLLTFNVFSQETIAIKDIGLEECLIDLDIDSNGLNGNILVSDAKYVVNLNINDPITNKLLPNVHSKIKNLGGLEHFPNLKRLDCFGNEITEIDLSKSTSITFLNCSENKIERLDLSNNTELVYVSCDGNKLNSLIIGDNPNLKSLYTSFNELTTLDVKACTELESLDTTGNQMNSIIVNDTQLNKIPEGWYKDENAVYTKNANSIKSVPKESVKEESKPTTSIAVQSKTKVSQPVTNNQPKESAANYYEKFQLSVVSEYDKLVLATSHTQSKKNELAQKYSLNPEQLLQWITKYSDLTVGNKNVAKTINPGAPQKYTATYYSKFKKSAVDEYEKAILNPAYLQSKKEEIQKKYNLNSQQFAKWIDLLGNTALKTKTIQSSESTESYYDKFKKSVVNEYDSLVLNASYIQTKKIEVQQKYSITANQLTEWISKHSKIKKH
ncbi:hypothetical protein [Tenacibaculum ovolyticum]|uniref:hypothetical protein n=1 Tax=Tenacibaculum ovolyticum TaxID=104270 RepID=UPI001F2A30F4|nr:hypothetical protein [Tenacibaculum ovolyticum]